MANMETTQPKKYNTDGKYNKKMSEKDKALWTKIYNFVEKEILDYDDNQHMQKAAVLRLRGLPNGKVMANNKVPDNGDYPLEVVYGAILLSKNAFREANRNKLFDNESMKVAYFCAIVRGQLNTVYKKWKENKLQKKVIKAIQAEEKHEGAEYKPKPRKTVANVSGSFW